MQVATDVRTRSSDWDMRCRPCVRCMFRCSAFPLVPGLGSTGSATGRPALFVGFVTTMPVMLPRILCALRLSGPRTRRIFLARGAHKLGVSLWPIALSRTSSATATPCVAPVA